VIITSLDTECTGLDKNKDRIIEVGLVLFSTGQNRVLESTGFLVQSDGVVVSDMERKGYSVVQAAVDKFGYDTKQALDSIEYFVGQSDAVLAHNGNRFDKPMVDNSAKRSTFNLTEKLWIDSMTDIPQTKGEQLITMAAKAGILLTGAHGALADASATVEMVRRHAQEPEKNWDKIVERAKSPIVILQSHQDRGKNADAKKLRFRWNPERKLWWRPVKEMDAAELIKAAPFDISRLDKSITLDQLDTDN